VLDDEWYLIALGTVGQHSRREDDRAAVSKSAQADILSRFS